MDQNGDEFGVVIWDLMCYADSFQGVVGVCPGCGWAC